MEIQSWPVNRPVPYARNARKLSPAAVDKVGASIREFGFRQPIVVDADGVVIVGHTRLQAAKQLGLAEVPVHIASGLTPAQVKAYRLADNRTNQETSWDDGLLGLELSELSGMDLDLLLTGFSGAEIDSLLSAASGGADSAEDEPAPEPPAAPVTILGDLWRCGDHRVLCGDSTSSDAVSRLFAAAPGNARPVLMVTDPPYGVEYDPSWRAEHDLGGAGKWASASRATGKVSNDDRVDWSPAWSLFPGDVAYVWHAGIFAGEVAASLFAAKFQIRAQIIWAKQHFVFGRGSYHWQHEPCWYAVRRGGAQPLARRPHPEHGLADPEPQSDGWGEGREAHRPWNTEAGRVYA